MKDKPRITKCPPGRAVGADDLTLWSAQRKERDGVALVPNAGHELVAMTRLRRRYAASRWVAQMTFEKWLRRRRRLMKRHGSNK